MTSCRVRRLWHSVAGVAVLACALLPSALQAQTVTASIPVTINPGTVVNPITNTIYVLNEPDVSNVPAESTLVVIDGATKTIKTTIQLGNFPFAIGANTATNTVYVTDELDENVSVIDGNTNTITAGPQSVLPLRFGSAKAQRIVYRPVVS